MNSVDIQVLDDVFEMIFGYEVDQQLVTMLVGVDYHLTEDELTVTCNDTLICHAFKQGEDIRVICKDGIKVEIGGKELIRDE